MRDFDFSRDVGFWDQMMAHNSAGGLSDSDLSNSLGLDALPDNSPRPLRQIPPTRRPRDEPRHRNQPHGFHSPYNTPRHHVPHSSRSNAPNQPHSSFGLPDFPLPPLVQQQPNPQPPPSQDLAFGPDFQNHNFRLPNLDSFVQEAAPASRSDSRSNSWGSSVDQIFEDLLTNTDNFGEFIDLTAEPSPPAMPAAIRKRKALDQSSDGSPSPPPNTAKRKRTGNLCLKEEDPEIEEVDLREVDDDKGLSKVLEEQQAAAVKAQLQHDPDEPLTLSKVQCVVCMDSMTDMTVTHCGHLFCHTCIMEALIAGENSGEPGKGHSRCPVCRKKVLRPRYDKPRGKDKRDIIPLEIKVVTRSKVDKGKGKALVAD